MSSQFPPKKNTAFTLYFSLYKNDGTIIANPGTYTKKVSIDGAAVADIAASITEEDTTYGQLSVVLAAGEMNGDAIWIYIKDDTTGCVPFTCTLYTAANTQDELGTSIAAILVDTGTTLDGNITAIKSKTDNLPASPAAVGSAMTLSNGAITAAVVATGAIDADALATDAVDEIADQVWNEGRVGHTSAGTFGEGVASVIGSVGSVAGSVDSIAAGGITSSSIAADAIQAGHIQAGAIDAATFAADAISAAAISTLAAEKICDSVWAEPTPGAYGVGTAGYRVGTNLDAAVSSRSTLTAQQVWEYANRTLTSFGTLIADIWASVSRTLTDKTGFALTSAYDPAKTAAQAGDAMTLTAAYDAAKTAATQTSVDTIDNLLDTEIASILAAVDTEVAAILADTNELQTDLVNGGRVDLLIDAIKAKTDTIPASPAAVSDIPTASAIADQVWDEAIAGHASAGSTGEALAGATAPSAATIADAVWDEAIAGHTSAGTTGNALSTASSGGVDPAALADAIWDEALSGHATAGTAGKKLTDLANADLSSLALAADLATVDSLVDAIKLKTDLIPASPAATGDIPTTGAIVTAMDGSSTKLANLDAAISSRLATAGYTAPDNAGIAAIQAQTDQMNFTGADINAVASVSVDEAAIAAAVLAGMGGGASVLIVSPIAQDGTITIVAGDDYLTTNNRAITITETGTSWPVLTGATVTFSTGLFTKACVVVTPTGTKVIRLDLTSTETRAIAPGTYTYQIEANVGGTSTTIITGNFIVTREIARYIAP